MCWRCFRHQLSVSENTVHAFRERVLDAPSRVYHIGGWLLRLGLRGPFCSFILGARACEEIDHSVVSLVACILEHGTFAFRHRDRGGPGLGERIRVVDGVLVEERVVVDTREAFLDVHLGAGPPEARFVREVRCVDDQRVAFPMATRIPAPLTDILRETGPIAQRDDAGGVDHFRENHEVIGGLEQPYIIIVDTRVHGRFRARTHEAPLPQVPVFRAVGWMHSRRAPRAARPSAFALPASAPGSYRRAAPR